MKLSWQVEKLTHFTATLAVVGICLTSIVLLQQSQLKPERSELTKAKYERQEQNQKVSLSLIRELPSFGFNNLIASWMVLEFIQYFGDGEARAQTGYSLSPEYFAAIVERDPQFIGAHLMLAPATSIFAGQPQKSVALIEQALQSISPKSSLSYYLWVYKGVDEMLFLGEVEAAKQSYEMAAKWAEASNDPDSRRVAASTRETAQFLARNPGSKTARIGAWTMLLSNAINEKNQQQIISQIKALGGEVIVTPEGRFRVRAPED